MVYSTMNAIEQLKAAAENAPNKRFVCPSVKQLKEAGFECDAMKDAPDERFVEVVRQDLLKHLEAKPVAKKPVADK